MHNHLFAISTQLKTLSRLGVASGILVLAACVHQPTVVDPEPYQPYTAEEKERLSQLEQLYIEGDYDGLLQSLNQEPLLEQGGTPFKTDAYKYQAFSYCTLGNKTACRTSFQKLLEANPGYLLTKAENTHPVWGPIFSVESRKMRSSRVWVKQDY